jgi:hypothetical protein
MCWYSVLLVLINMHGENNIKYNFITLLCTIFSKQHAKKRTSIAAVKFHRSASVLDGSFMLHGPISVILCKETLSLTL